MVKTDYPRGKGLFLWQIKMIQPLYPDAITQFVTDIRNAGLVEDSILSNKTNNPGVIRALVDRVKPQSAVSSPIVQAALDLGLDWVAPKVSNGIFKYNLRWNGLKYVDDILPPLVKQFQDAGIKVVGWQYIYGYSGFAEKYAQQGIDRTRQLNLDGFMINAEKQYKGKPREAEKYAAFLRAGLPDISIGLSSYRYPSYHRDFPFYEFAQYCDYHSPQVYWLGSHNPRWQLEKSMNELKLIRDLPIIPAGLAYTEGGYPPPTEGEMDEFHQAVLEFDLPGNLWWEWGRAAQIGRLGTIAAHEWPEEAPPDQPDPPQIPPANPDLEKVLDDMQAVVDKYR